MGSDNGLSIHFPPEYDARSEYEATLRGYLSNVEVHVDGHRFRLFFIAPIRLEQELKLSVESGRNYLAEANLVVVPEVSTESIRAAIEGLKQDGFFQELLGSMGPDAMEIDVKKLVREGPPSGELSGPRSVAG